jgi:SPP1 family predicted phage head-tail adaptor
MYSASSLRKSLEFLGRTVTPDGGGGKRETWVSKSPQDIVAAGSIRASKRDRNVAEKTAPIGSYRFVIRYRSDVSVRDRVQYGSRQLEIVGLADVEERGSWLELDCEERIGE